ncbi:MAG: hypothetical protein WCA90_01375 [Ilumatobacteraceae bacterium]
MGAGTVTLRVGTQLVGLRADTDATLARLRALFAAWVDDAQPDVPWLFDVRIDTGTHNRPADAVAIRGPRPVPQLRLGQLLMARSRHADDVLRALAGILGGVLARQDDALVWSGMRAFAGEDGIVLVDARPPTLTADATITDAGIRELPTWTVSIDGTMVRVPPPLDGLDWAAVGVDPPAKDALAAPLAGIVAFDTSHPDPHDARRSTAPAALGDQGAGAAMLTRFAARHPSTTWFSIVERLVRDGRISISADRTVVRQRIVELIGR